MSETFWNDTQKLGALMGIIGFSVGSIVTTGAHAVNAGPWATRLVSNEAKRAQLKATMEKCESLLEKLQTKDKFLRKVLDKMVPGFVTQFEGNLQSLYDEYWALENMLSRTMSGWNSVTHWTFNRKHIEKLRKEVEEFLDDQQNTSTSISSRRNYKQIREQYQMLLQHHHDLTSEEFSQKVDELVETFANSEAPSISDNPYTAAAGQPRGPPITRFPTAPNPSQASNLVRDIPMARYQSMP